MPKYEDWEKYLLEEEEEGDRFGRLTGVVLILWLILLASGIIVLVDMVISALP